MRVLIDTSVLSLVLRRPTKRLHQSQRALAHAVRDVISDGRMVLLGAVRQEVLSGIADTAAFERLRSHLRAFPDEPLESSDYEQAAHFTNQCNAAGVQGSPTDFLICAAAFLRGLAIMTSDRDYTRYAEHLPIRLHEP